MHYAKELKHLGIQIFYEDLVNTNPTTELYGSQIMKSAYSLFINQTADIAPGWKEEISIDTNNQ